jgi:hypothetical protein
MGQASKQFEAKHKVIKTLNESERNLEDIDLSNHFLPSNAITE